MLSTVSRRQLSTFSPDSRSSVVSLIGWALALNLNRLKGVGFRILVQAGISALRVFLRLGAGQSALRKVTLGALQSCGYEAS